jgi:uncharacterized protein YoxC
MLITISVLLISISLIVLVKQLLSLKEVERSHEKEEKSIEDLYEEEVSNKRFN